MKYKPKTKPFPHQSRAVIRAVRARNYAFHFEPRLGKTKAALDYVGIMALKDLCERVLVIAPAIAIQVWEEQLELHMPLDYSVENFTEYWGDGETLNFFLAGREETMRAPKRGAKRVRTKQAVLEEYDPDVVIIDESHEYKRPGGRGAQDAWRMIRRLRAKRRTHGDESGRPYVLELTGTPSPKTYRDLFAQFRILDDTIFGTNASDFDEEWVKYGSGSRKYTIIRFNQPEKFLHTVRKHSYAVSAEEAGLAGKIMWQRLTCDLPQKARRIYNDMATEMLAEWEEGTIDATNVGVKRLRLLQIAGGFTTDGIQIHRAKLDTLRAYLITLRAQEEKCIIYARFLAEVDAIEEVARRCGYRALVVPRSTDVGGRANVLRRFRHGTDVALISQVQRIKQAVDLSSGAEVIYYSTPDGWVDYFQSLNRVRGPNQKRPVRITHIVARSTVDLAAWDGLRRKEDTHATLMRSMRRYLT